MLNIIFEKISLFKNEIASWRQHLHQYPELSAKEYKTTKYISNLLKKWKISISTDFSKTGVIGTLESGTSTKTIAFRAEIDALPIQEENCLKFQSTNKGVMHACGHDGHSAMLLGAAKYLSQSKNFNGKVIFIFQPAEEIGGAKELIENGLLKKFKIDKIFGIHNAYFDAKTLVINDGPILASYGGFEITLEGEGGHAAFAKSTSDLVSFGAELIQKLNNNIKKISTKNKFVFAITQIQAGKAKNVFPTLLTMSGSYRCLNNDDWLMITENIKKTVKLFGESHRLKYKIEIKLGPPSLVNTTEETKAALRAALDIVDESKIITDNDPVFAVDDFAEYLRYVPGCYISLGNGIDNGRVHTPQFRFNDGILTLGATLLSQIVENELK